MRAKLAVLAACVCFGTLGTARELARVEASSVSVGLARVLLGGGLLAVVALIAQRSNPMAARPDSSVRRTPLGRLPTFGVIALGAIGVLAYQPFFLLGTRSNGVAVGTVLALGSAPVLTGLVDSLLRRRPPSPRWFVATALCLVGVTMVSGILGSGSGSSVGQGGAGVLWSVGAGASYAVYTLTAKELIERGWTSQGSMGALFGWAAAASVPLLALTQLDWLATGRGLALFAWLGIVTITVGYLLFGWGLARLPATTVTTMTLAEPLCATLLGIGLLHEHLSATAAAGLLVLATGLAVLTVSRRKEPVVDPGLLTPPGSGSR